MTETDLQLNIISFPVPQQTTDLVCMSVLPAVLEHVQDVVSEGVPVLLQDPSDIIQDLTETDRFTMHLPDVTQQHNTVC